MNVVENIRYNVPLPLFCLLIILSGCNFREVLDDYPVSGVQITLDWTGVAENLPETVRVIFYPKDAEGRKVDGYLPAAGGEMKVPPGHYAMIVYNYNTECVCIEGDECYGTIRAYTERCIGMDAGEDMIWSPDDFYVVALDDVEIAKSEAAMVMKLKPERVVSSYSFAVMAVSFSVEGCVHLQKCPFMWRMIVKTDCCRGIFRISGFRKVRIRGAIVR